eukprot:TRINITY_DN74390_c0_g1_i1.p1 TRINITY_DN74390_c0_g1~~TRINITY_DN74390_c0_g1_i1.p1  ORF type:complete len:365 (-),score=81.24 TRINITY_DN74390_c0_g1_i1:256-1350(-)
MTHKITDTKELLQKVCKQLDHEEGARPCIKKLVVEQWLVTVDDLRRVPRLRLEKWGVPLKLVEELCEILIDAEATAVVNNTYAYVNYTLRPSLQLMTAGAMFESLRDDAERRRNPRAWAARKLQQAFRRWKKEKAKREDAEFVQNLYSSLSKNDFCRKSEEEAALLREKRANDKIRRMVRRWQARRRSGDGDSDRLSIFSVYSEWMEEYLTMCPSGTGCLVVPASIRACQGALKECEVTRLLRKFARKLQRPWEEILPYVHRLVTFNWIETCEDLSLIDEHHWNEWEFPEGLVVLIKEEVEAQSKPGFRAAASSALMGAGNCIIGDLVGAAVDWMSSWAAYQDEAEKQRQRADEIRLALDNACA